jgi:uncharacterized protein YdiU (UPF0061 family)
MGPAHEPRWLELGEGFSDVVTPARFPRHVLRWRNDRAAASIGLAGLDAAAWEDAFARFAPMPGNLPEPHALRYHGHQFQHYNPRLGDGRGFLYAQLREQEGRRRLLDLGTKGSGTTPYSRGGDGRLTLKGGVREILATEMLEALGVDTSKSFSLFETGESLQRHDEPSPTRASVLVRLSHGHVRFGTFQRLAHVGDTRGLARLLGYATAHYLPGVAPEPAAFLREVCARTARTCGSWMAAGFVHGVLNTDNMNITGESFDYGPWRFAPTFDPDMVAAYFDEVGLYAFGRQPDAVYWNLCALREALAPLGDPLDGVFDAFAAEWHAGLRATFLRRLGVRSCGEAGDTALVEASVRFLAGSRAPLDAFFHDWWGGPAAEARALSGPRAAWWDRPAFHAVRDVLQAFAPRAPRLLADASLAGPPVDMTIDVVEELWAPIAAADDWSAFASHVERVRALGARLDADDEAAPSFPGPG